MPRIHRGAPSVPASVEYAFWNTMDPSFCHSVPNWLFFPQQEGLGQGKSILCSVQVALLDLHQKRGAFITQNVDGWENWRQKKKLTQ